MAAYNNLCDIFTLKEIRDIILFRTKAYIQKSKNLLRNIPFSDKIYIKH